MIDKLELKTQQPETKSCSIKAKAIAQNNCSQTVDKSIYNSKGSSVYFCGLVRGLSRVEEDIANELRQFMVDGKRKFNEHSIRDFMEHIQKAKTTEDKKFMREALDALLLDEENQMKYMSDGRVVRNVFNDYEPKDLNKVLKSFVDRSEEDKFALLDFAEYELRNATDPMTSFNNLPRKTQDDLLKLIHKVKDLHYGDMMADNGLDTEACDGLYDLFKVAMYAHEDLSKLSAVEAKLYKQEQLEIIRSDIDYWQKCDKFADEKQKQKTIAFAKDVLNYFEKTFCAN